MNARRFTMATAVLAAVLTGALVMASVPALAIREYVQSVAIGHEVNQTKVVERQAEEADGELVTVSAAEEDLCTAASGDSCQVAQEGAGKSEFSRPTGVAVNDATGLAEGAGDLYVVDNENNRVERFSSAGAFLGQFNGSGTFEVEGKVQTGPAAPSGQLAAPSYVAVDDSGNPLDPSNGDVYVVDRGNDVVDKFGPTGEYLAQLTETEPGVSFGALKAVAVDHSGDLWLENQPAATLMLDEFSPTGTLLKAVNAKGESAFGSLAVDAQYVYVGEENTVRKFEVQTGAEVAHFSTPTFTGSGVYDLAVDPLNEDLVLDDNEGNCACESEIHITGPGGEPYFNNPQAPNFLEPTVLQTVHANPLVRLAPGIAINAEGTLYVSEAHPNYQGEVPVNEVRSFTYTLFPTVALAEAALTEAGVTLHGSVNPEGEEVTECEFEYGTEAGEYSHRTSCSPNGPLTGTAAVPVSAALVGLAPRTSYYYRLTARARASKSVSGTFFTATRPQIEGEGDTGVGASEATIEAMVDAAGLPTAYHVEYGTTEAYGASTPEASIGATKTSVHAVAHLEGLQTDTRYHARVVAVNAFGTTRGADIAFTTHAPVPVTARTLPDERAYELVSAPEDTEVYVPHLGQGGGGLEGEFTAPLGAMRAAAGGDVLAYIADPPASGVSGSGEQGSRGNEYLAKRSTAGWQTRDIEFPERGAQGVGGQFQDFSEDLSVLTAIDNYPIVSDPMPAAGCDSAPAYNFTPYTFAAGSYHALITASRLPGQCGANVSEGISADGEHVLLASPYAYVTGAHEGGGEGEANLYDSVGGSLYQVNVLPGGEPELHPYATFGAPNAFVGDISADGDRVIWTDLNTEVTAEDPTGATRLFVRENDIQPQSPISGGQCTVTADACTVQVDASQGGVGVSGGGQFQAASADGTRIFFTDESRLTATSTAAAGEPDLYEYQVGREAGQAGMLVDVTVALAGHADVRSVIGASKDGSYVYFLADGVLTRGANAEGKEPLVGQPNLYLSHNGTTTFIVTNPVIISGEESHMLEAKVAPSGRAVAFRSAQQLTGYENYGLPEIYIYRTDASRIDCISYSPSGASPVPSAELWENAANAMVGASGNQAFGLRWINEAGSEVFFMTNQPLIAQDTNDHLDVYEWESEGTGGCEMTVGCVAPLSDVNVPDDAFLVDASANGEDVFFTQRATLTANAVDEDVKLYDARVDGGFPEPALACTGTGCQGVPPAPPVFATPSSATFNGVGNFEAATPAKTVAPKKKTAAARAKKLAKALEACARKPKRKRAACRRQARKRYGQANKKGK
jgi:hypothetical protein